MDSGCLTEVVKKNKKSAMLGTHTIDECFHSFSEFYKTFMSVSSIIMHIIYVLVFISNEIKAVSNSPVMFSNFLSFRFFIF